MRKETETTIKCAELLTGIDNTEKRALLCGAACAVANTNNRAVLGTMKLAASADPMLKEALCGILRNIDENRLALMCHDLQNGSSTKSILDAWSVM